MLASGDSYWSQEEHDDARLHVIDLSDPAAPGLAPALARPAALMHGGLQGFGESVVSWHLEAVDGNPSKVRWYLDRLDVSTPSEPRLLPTVNVPGAVVAYDEGSQRAVTVGFARGELEGATDDECYEQPKFHEWDYDADRCFLAHRDLSLVRTGGT